MASIDLSTSERLTYSTHLDEATQVVEVAFFDGETSAPLGSIRVLRKRLRALLQHLGITASQLSGSFYDNDVALANYDPQEGAGDIRFAAHPDTRM